MPVLKVQKADGTYDIIQTSGLSGSEIIVSATQPVGVPDGALWLDTSDNEFQGTIYDDIFDNLNNKPDRLSAVETVNVGSGGDFATINEAIAYATTKYPQYVTNSTKAEFVINLLSGFVMAEQVIVKGLNLGWIRITGADAETVIQRSALTQEFQPFTSAKPAFGVLSGGKLPTIDHLFNMDTSGTAGTQAGIFVGGASGAHLYPNAGVKNAAWVGLYSVASSNIQAQNTDFSGAGVYGIYANGTSTIYAQGAKANNVGTTIAHYAVYATDGSTIGFNSGEAMDCSGVGIYAEEGSIIDARGAVAHRGGVGGIHATYNAIINAHLAQANDVGTTTAHVAVFASNTSTIQFGAGSATGCSGVAVAAVGRSNINARNATATGAGVNGILAGDNSQICAIVSNAMMGASPSPNDIAINGGSIIAAHSATGGLFQTKNTLTVNGIIFQP